jgi:hypothetical protein
LPAKRRLKGHKQALAPAESIRATLLFKMDSMSIPNTSCKARGQFSKPKDIQMEGMRLKVLIYLLIAIEMESTLSLLKNLISTK